MQSFGRRNFRNLQLDPASLNRPVVEQSDNDQSLLVGLEFDINLQSSEIMRVADLGRGSSGDVTKVCHTPTGLVMARKAVKFNMEPEVLKYTKLELKILHECDSEYIVKYYGMYVDNDYLMVCMEYMDCGSLDNIYKATGPLQDDIIASINACVVDGLSYLKERNITHRDLKPSNILVSSSGFLKLCDFGVSGELINSVVNSFVGTSTYMSPERITGGAYTSTGDVWSLGLTLVELATGRFPFGEVDPTEQGVFSLLQTIVNYPPPTLPQSCCLEFQSYINGCLRKDPNKRMKLRELRSNPFYTTGRQNMHLLKDWAAQLPRK